MPALTRREWFKIGVAAGAAAGLCREEAAAQDQRPGKDRWRLALNVSTIRPAPLEEKIEVTAKAGYDGVELWANELEKYEKEGKSLQDLAQRIKGLGLVVVNVIGLWNSMPDKEADKAKSDESIRIRLRQAAQVGARCIAAIPAPDQPELSVLWAAKRYRELLAMGREFGVTVAIEFVSFLKGIHTLGQAAAIAIEADDPEACIVCDSFHIYRGGSSFKGVTRLNGRSLAVCHFNDVPNAPPQDQLKDSDRIYPGDGILPLKEFLRDLWTIGFRGPLSLELFNQAEWKKNPLDVAKLGIEKTRAVIAASGTGT